MTDHAQAIADRALDIAAGAALAAGATDLHAEPGWCLAAARRTVETALGQADGRFYQLFGRERVEREPGPPATSWWARDLERSMRNLGLAVPIDQVEPGDLLFNHRAAPNRHGVYVGHVGVLTYRWLVLENVDPRWRPQALKRGSSCLMLTPLRTFPVTTAIRIPPREWRPA